MVVLLTQSWEVLDKDIEKSNMAIASNLEIMTKLEKNILDAKIEIKKLEEEISKIKEERSKIKEERSKIKEERLKIEEEIKFLKQKIEE